MGHQNKADFDPRFERMYQAVVAAGGAHAVAARFGLTRQTVYHWWTNGLPRTEYTGETAYAAEVCRMALDNGQVISLGSLLEETREYLLAEAKKTEARRRARVEQNKGAVKAREDARRQKAAEAARLARAEKKAAAERRAKEARVQAAEAAAQKARQEAAAAAAEHRRAQNRIKAEKQKAAAAREAKSAAKMAAGGADQKTAG